MTARRCLTSFAAVVVAACSGPPPRPPSPEPTATPPPAAANPEAKPPVARSTTTPPLQVVQLDNGITAAIQQSSQTHTATLQLGLLAGATFLAPGASELAAQVLVDGSDPSEGRPALAQAIAQLGGTLRVEPGLQTTWIDVRVPRARWQQAATAIRDALARPTRSRHQIERVRDDFVKSRTAAIRDTPLATMAQLLLLGETSGSGHLLGLLDRDPGEIGLLHSNLYRPDRVVFAIEVADPPAEVQQALARGGKVALGGWQPPAPLPGTVAVLDRPFAPGLWWSPAAGGGALVDRCRVAVLIALPTFQHPEPAAALLLHSCFSLEGVGGRLEQVQQERGLAHVRWQADVVTAGEATALLLTTEVAANEVANLWRAVELARASLTDVPPNASEFALALRRVPLQAAFGAQGDGARLRQATLLALGGKDLAAIERRAAEIARLPATGIAVPATTFLELPFAMIVVGGQVPADLPQARHFALTPVGGEAPVTTAPDEQAPAGASPWLVRAIDAIGAADDVRRLAGWTCSATIGSESTPTMAETTNWHRNGTLRRTRSLLGQVLETSLVEQAWTERLGKATRTLGASEAQLLRREQQRHPLALLAAHARGELPFRTIARRDVGDRSVAVLEAAGGGFDRLRVHVDTGSHLVRAVESWETLADGTVMHLSEAWSDYRTVRGLRVPFHRLTTQDDGQNRVETVFTRWEPALER